MALPDPANNGIEQFPKISFWKDAVLDLAELQDRNLQEEKISQLAKEHQADPYEIWTILFSYEPKDSSQIKGYEKINPKNLALYVFKKEIESKEVIDDEFLDYVIKQVYERKLKRLQIDQIAKLLKSKGVTNATFKQAVKDNKPKIDSSENPRFAWFIDSRFNEPTLLKEIYQELDRDHKHDDKQKLLIFLVLVSAFLPDPEERISSKQTGNSRSGKNNIVNTAVKHIPDEFVLNATRMTRSEFEDRLTDKNRHIKIVFLNELNIREGGANMDLIEPVKQLTDSGLRIFKKDMDGNSQELFCDRKTCLWGTTDIQKDEELQNRVLEIPIDSSIEKNKEVCKDYLNKQSDLDYLSKNISKPESWISLSIRYLYTNHRDRRVFIPFSDQVFSFFEYQNDRIKDDLKKMMSLTKSIAFLHQTQRQIINHNGQEWIIADPSDFEVAYWLLNEVLKLNLGNLDKRVLNTYEKAKSLIGSHRDLIRAKIKPETFGNNVDDSLFEKLSDWVIRSELQKDLNCGLTKIKAHLSQLFDSGLIEYPDRQEKNRLPSNFVIFRPVVQPVTDLSDLSKKTGKSGNKQVVKQVSEYNKSDIKKLDITELQRLFIKKTPKLEKKFSEGEKNDRYEQPGCNPTLSAQKNFLESDPTEEVVKDIPDIIAEFDAGEGLTIEEIEDYTRQDRTLIEIDLAKWKSKGRLIEVRPNQWKVA